jgi:hypothetical protein
MPRFSFYRHATVAFMTLAFWLSSTGPSLSKFDPGPFESDKRTVLGIDLSDESNISIGVVLRGGGTTVPLITRITLPFQTTEAGANEQVLSTWGSYNGSTYLSLVLPGGSVAYYPIELKPIINRPDPNGASNASTSPFIFIVDGQLRKFIYRYPSDKPSGSSASSIVKVYSIPLDAIAVRLPQNANPTEVVPGKTSDPPELFYKDRVGFFPAVRPEGGKEQLELRYMLQTTDRQKAWIEFLSKIFAALGAPILTILLTKSRVAGARRRSTITSGIIVQSIVLLLIGTLWFRWSDTTLMSNIFFLGIGVVGEAAAFFVWRFSD